MLSYNFITIVNYYSLMSYFHYVTFVRSQDRILLFRVSQCFCDYSAIPFHIGEGTPECHLRIKFSENKRFRKIRKKKTSIAAQVWTFNWAASSEFGTYRLCEQGRFRRACASAQSRQNLRCSLIQAVSQEEPSDRKPYPCPLWVAGHARLKSVMTECSKTQIRLTRPN